jgi:hypothetical protein
MPIWITPIIIGMGSGAFVYSKVGRYAGREKMAISAGIFTALFVALIVWSVIDIFGF